MTGEFEDEIRERVAALPDATGRFDGFLPGPDTFPFRLLLPRKRRWRWEVVEFTGTGTRSGGTSPSPLDEVDGGGWRFGVVGPLTRIVHPRRFWLRRSAMRYMGRIEAAKGDDGGQVHDAG